VFIDQDWAEPKGSFGRPVLPPNFDPSASPTRTFTINCSWVPFIRGALLQLVEQATWKTDDPDVLTLAQMRAMTLIGMFDECSTVVLPFSCDFDIESSTDGAPFQLRPEPTTSVSPQSVFTPDVGFTDVYFTYSGGAYAERWAECETFFTERHITLIVMGYDLTKGTFDTNNPDATVIIGWHAGSIIFEQAIDSDHETDGSGKALGWSGDELLDQITLRVTTGNIGHVAEPGGSAAIRTCRVDGYASTSLCGSE